MNCKKCGQELFDGEKFCSYCGTPIPTIPQRKSHTSPISEFQTSTTSSIPGYNVQSSYGVINATIAISKDIVISSFDSLLGNFGAVRNAFKQGHAIDEQASQIFDDLNKTVTARLIEVANNTGCNAIIGLKYEIQTVDDYFFLSAYGTACIVK